MDRKLVLWLGVALLVLGAALLTQGVLSPRSPQGTPGASASASASAEGNAAPPAQAKAPSPAPVPAPGQGGEGVRLSREAFLDPIWQARQYIQQHYYKPEAVDDRKLQQEAIRGLVRGLDDPFSYYKTLEEFQRFEEQLEGEEYEGIGAYIGQRDGWIVIIAPIKGGPAERAGVRAGDIVLEIDGESTQGFSVDDAARRLRGPKGTPVTIKVRHLDGSVEEITIVRETIKAPLVEYELLRPGIGYVRLNAFGSASGREVRRALDALQREAGGQLEGLVLDLRGNGGGFLSAANAVAGLFLDRGMTVLVERSRAGERVHTSRGNALPNWPIAVLVDEGTASASEIVAGAIRDNNLGVLVGRRTFGKGVVQTTFPLPDGSRLFVTTSEWLTPSRRPIQDVGLVPDFVVESWFPAFMAIRRELRGLEALLPDFAEAGHAALQRLNDRLNQIETYAGQDEYAKALEALDAFESALQRDPAELLQEAGAAPDDPESLLVGELLKRLARSVREKLPELRERLRRNDLAVALEWLEGMRGRTCPCDLPPPPTPEPEPEPERVGVGGGVGGERP